MLKMYLRNRKQYDNAAVTFHCQKQPRKNSFVGEQLEKKLVTSLGMSGRDLRDLTI